MMSDSAGDRDEDMPRPDSKETNVTRPYMVPPLPDGAVERAASQKRTDMSRSEVSQLLSTERKRGFS